MCYLIAKDVDKAGCIALRTTHGKHLSEFKRTIENKVGYEKIITLISSSLKYFSSKVFLVLK